MVGYADGETGLNYNGARDYDPTSGRYIESDPIGLGGGINTYVYAGNNPVNFVDPFGASKNAAADSANLASAFLNTPVPEYDWDTGERVGTTTVGAQPTLASK
jgi:RHS repeat-associated protein